jgi:hypothetical protein
MDERALALLADIRDELRALRVDLAERRDQRRLSPSDLDLLTVLDPAIKLAVGPRAFTVCELKTHADLPQFGALRDGIAAAGGANKVGRLLKRAAGVDVHGLQIRCVGTDREGLLRALAASGRVDRIAA